MHVHPLQTEEPMHVSKKLTASFPALLCSALVRGARAGYTRGRKWENWQNQYIKFPHAMSRARHALAQNIRADQSAGDEAAPYSKCQ